MSDPFENVAGIGSALGEMAWTPEGLWERAWCRSDEARQEDAAMAANTATEEGVCESLRRTGVLE